MPLHVLVRGRVQGVGFRWFVRQEARALHLSGWVRNRADGSVEVAAEGSAADLARLRVLVQRGPDGATVESVDDLDQIKEPLPAPFAIAR